MSKHHASSDSKLSKYKERFSLQRQQRNASAMLSNVNKYHVINYNSRPIAYDLVRFEFAPYATLIARYQFGANAGLCIKLELIT